MQDEGSAPRRTENPPHAVGVVLPGGRAGAAGPRLRLVLLLVFVAGWALAAIKPPLAEVHWDAPIMLYASKRVVDTDFHANFVRDAAEVARQVEQADWDRSVSNFP